MDIILVRHGTPKLEPAQSASAWPLDPDAASGIDTLAKSLEHPGVDVVVSSDERKARETAAILARHLGVPTGVDQRFGEQGLDTVPWIEVAHDFRAAVRRHFEEPGMRVLGDESSTEAARRFAAAMDDLRERARLPIVVSHGRVMTAYAAMVADIVPWPFWADLRMPDAFALGFERRTCRRIERKAHT